MTHREIKYREALEAYMRQHRLTPNGLARKLGLTQPSVRRWVKGTCKPSPLSAIRIEQHGGPRAMMLYPQLGTQRL